MWDAAREVQLARARGEHPDLGKIVGSALEQRGVEEDAIIVCIKVAKAIAEDIVREYQRDIMKEVAAEKAAIRPFIELVRPLVDVGLGPYDKIVSLGIEGPDGEVRVVSL